MIPASRFKRFIASFIDGLILSIFSSIVLLILALAMGRMDDIESFMLKANLVFYPVMFIYYSFLESSLSQASLGKRLLKLYVSDLGNQKISLAKAFSRCFLWLLPLMPIAYMQVTSSNMDEYSAKMNTYWWLTFVCSLIYFIEFIPVFFTKERSTLYDIFTSTRVNKNMTEVKES